MPPKIIALVREPDPSILRCELTHVERSPIVFEKLQRQHLLYQNALSQLGLEVRSLPALPGSPDGVFVEDTAVVLDELALIARPGAASRAIETQSVLSALGKLRKNVHVLHNGTLDGGDVLRIGRKIFVGVSSRTTLAAISEATEVLRPYGYKVTAVPVSGCLHLKTAITALDDNTVVANSNWVDLASFSTFRVISVDPGEPFGANVLRAGKKLLYAAEHPRTAARLQEAGFSLQLTPISELAKAEAGVTCLSLVFSNGITS